MPVLMQHQSRDKNRGKQAAPEYDFKSGRALQMAAGDTCGTPQGGGSNHQQYGFTAGILGGGHAFS